MIIVGSLRGFESNNRKLAFATSDNPAAHRRFMDENFSEKVEINSALLPNRRPYPDYSKLPNFHSLSWTETPTFDREPDDFQPRAQIKRLFVRSILVSVDSESIREFSDKYIVPKKLVAEYVEQMRKEKMKEENRRDRMERLNREYNDIDWVGRYNSDKVSFLRVNKLSLYLSHQKITCNGKKAENVAIIKAHISSLLHNSSLWSVNNLGSPPLRNVQQQVTSSLSEIETDSQSTIDGIVVSCSSSLNDESSPHSDFIPEACQETLPPSKYGRKRARSERDDCVSWEKITI